MNCSLIFISRSSQLSVCDIEKLGGPGDKAKRICVDVYCFVVLLFNVHLKLCSVYLEDDFSFLQSSKILHMISIWIWSNIGFTFSLSLPWAAA